MLQSHTIYGSVTKSNLYCLVSGTCSTVPCDKTYLSLSYVTLTGVKAMEDKEDKVTCSTKQHFHLLVSNSFSSLLDKQVKRQHSSSSVSEAERNEICLFFVRKGCSFKGTNP